MAEGHIATHILPTPGLYGGRGHVQHRYRMPAGAPGPYSPVNVRVSGNGEVEVSLAPTPRR